MRWPGGKLLVGGVRLTGKTSVLERAVETVNTKGDHAFLADFSTATSLVDLATWIDERMRAVGLDPVEAGARCITLAGARTRDIVRLARKCVDRAGAEVRVDAADVDAAYVEIVDEEADSTQRWWSQLTGVQQKVMRAVAASSQGLTTGATRGRFALEQTGSISKTLARFVAEGAVVKTSHGSGYTFDDPYVRGWVLVHAVPDLGLQLPATHIASPTSEYD